MAFSQSTYSYISDKQGIPGRLAYMGRNEEIRNAVFYLESPSDYGSPGMGLVWYDKKEGVLTLPGSSSDEFAGVLYASGAAGHFTDFPNNFSDWSNDIKIYNGQTISYITQGFPYVYTSTSVNKGDQIGLRYEVSDTDSTLKVGFFEKYDAAENVLSINGVFERTESSSGVAPIDLKFNFY